MEALSLEGARMQREERRRRALDKAKRLGLRAYRVDKGGPNVAVRTYFVPTDDETRKGQGYHLKAGQHPAVGGCKYEAGGWYVRCECEAGLHGVECKHGAAVHRSLRRELSRLRLVGAVCPRCGTENAPGSATCQVCSQHPQQATAVREREAAPGAGGGTGPASGYELGDFFAA